MNIKTAYFRFDKKKWVERPSIKRKFLWWEWQESRSGYDNAYRNSTDILKEVSVFMEVNGIKKEDIISIENTCGWHVWGDDNPSTPCGGVELIYNSNKPDPPKEGESPFRADCEPRNQSCL